MNQQLASPDFRVEIYPTGLRVRRGGLNKTEPPDCDERGDITTFSHKAARRLREWFMTQYVPRMSLFAVTLTTHAIFSPSDWRAISKRFRQSLVRVGFAGVWRVELQKRKTPHLHVAFWLPASDSVNDIRTLWLRATGEHNDAQAFEYAVYSKPISQDEAGWAVYMGLHDGKHKTEQLGWLGKQWGIWNRGKYVERAPVVFDLNTRQHGAFLRFLRRLEIANRRSAAFRAWHLLLNAEWDLVEAPRAWRLIKAFRRRGMVTLKGGVLFVHVEKSVKMHKGNLLRLMRGEIAAQILNAMKAGVIAHPSTFSPT
jgi:hypothetical protein